MTAGLLTLVDLATIPADERLGLTRRSAAPATAVRAAAGAICDEVAEEGDRAMTRIAAQVGGGFRPVEEAELDEALERLDETIRGALERSAGAIAAFHRAQLPSPITVGSHPGVEVTRRWSPLRRVGAYVPGGTAAYPSSVLMTVVPARVAGVAEIVVATPATSNGAIDATTAAACALAGATEVWAMGGAQAVAALAYGTESIRPVQKIVGPGNAWVTAAKLSVLGQCAIDLPAGPSEVLVLADDSADAGWVAIDLLSQAEHGADSPAVLVTTDAAMVTLVEQEIAVLLPTLDRSPVLAEALSRHAVAVTAPDLETAVSFVNEYAAEHVTVATRDAEAVAERITAAGSVFVGHWAAESAGDYATGANHVLPTGGLAGACGPLAVEDFGSWRQVQRIDRQGLETMAPTITALAKVEGLTAHGLAAELRLGTAPEDRT